ncbi:MAG: C1 family peptidase [Ignavibacteria bacterium]|nr:C1 family peptidase [Ignavibacteria bacterium]
MRKLNRILFVFILLLGFFTQSFSQDGLTPIVMIEHSPVKDQGMTGTCWSFATLSLLESEAIKNGYTDLNISEMYIVRNIYIEKARNYILRQGKCNFAEGAMGHDVIFGIAKYGAMTEEAYSGLKSGKTYHNHSILIVNLKNYLDKILENIPISNNWEAGYIKILDDFLGKPPEKFTYRGIEYTPKEFAEKVLNFNPDNYINITSFTHHPFYQPFILEVPDNFSGGAYYNVPLDEFMEIARNAVLSGYSVLWDADVSNENFKMDLGYAMQWKTFSNNGVDPDADEIMCTQEQRQFLFENLTTQDDHLMQFVGLEKSKSGKLFYYTKNSWGEIGKFKGYLKVSEAYFAMNTIAIILNKNALTYDMKVKLGLK